MRLLKLPMMKQAIFLFISLLGSFSWARPQSYGHVLLEEISDLAQKCIIHPYRLDPQGEKVYSDYRNLCPQIRLITSTKALVGIRNNLVVVVLKEEQNSDGGD